MRRLEYLLRFVHRILSFLGLDLLRPFFLIKGLPLFMRQLFELRRQGNNDFAFSLSDVKPMLFDRRMEAGVMSGHYFHQDLYVSRKIFINRPIRHIDIGSRIDGMVAHVASFREIEVFDIRAIKSSVTNIKFSRGDLMDDSFNLYDCCDSISSLHAIEHFGLGRYGDPINYHGHILALKNIYKMLKMGGRFYFSVPIGRQRIEFNAHRVFSIRYLLDVFNGCYSLQSFAFVDDRGRLHEDVNLSADMIHSNCGCEYGCGIFELVKVS